MPVAALYIGFQAGQQETVPGVRAVGYLRHKSFFLLLFDAYNIILLQPEHLSLPFFPAVGNGSLLGSIFEENILVISHILIPDIQLDGPGLDAYRVNDMLHLVHLEGG